MRRLKKKKMRTCSFQHALCAAVLVSAAFGAAAQTAGVERGEPGDAPEAGVTAEGPGVQDVLDEPGSFEETEPPPWTAAEAGAAVEALPEEIDPAAMQKTRETAAQMDTRREGAGGAAPAPAESRAERSLLEYSLRGAAALFAVLALIFLVAYFAKRMGRRTPLLAGGDLARVLGKVYLAPRVSLHFVRTGGKVLAIGVTQNTISLVAEFDASAFQLEAAERGNAATATGEAPESFLTQLRTYAQGVRAQSVRAQSVRKDKETASDTNEEDLAALRADIQRLQEYLKENFRGARGE